VDWVYDISKFAVRPPAAADLHAGEAKITEYHRITSLADLKAALANKLLVVAGIAVYESFESFNVSLSGNVPMPDKTKEKLLGGHAVTLVGYDDDNQIIIGQNSWGKDWGNFGFFTLPYDYITDKTLTSDMWTATIKAAPTPTPPADPTIIEAIDLFTSKGIFDSPDFWKNLAQKYENDTTSDFRYVSLAFIKLAKYILEHQ
jgi:hypothetical protein